MSARKSWRRSSMLPPGALPPVSSRLQASQQAPPSSSIALIVQNLPKTGDARDSIPVPEKEAFQALLNELFQEEDGNDDISQNHAIIPIITGAGICVLLKDDPFASMEELMKQAENSLMVLRIVIRRTPECLFCPPPPGSSQKDQTYLGLWLVAKLLPILAHLPAQSLVDQLLATIQAVFIAAANVADDRVYLKTMVDFCQSCYHSAIWSFCEKSTIQSAAAKTFQVEFPPETFSVPPNAWKGLNQFDPIPLRFKIQNPEAAGLIGIHLHSLFVQLNIAGEGHAILANAIARMSALQQGLSKMWSTLNVWDTLPVVCEMTESIRLRILQALKESVTATLPGASGDFRSQSLYLLATRCLLNVLNRPAERNNQLVEHAIAGLLLELLTLAENSQFIQSLVKDRLLPAASSLMTDEPTWKLLCHDLQISILSVSYYFNGTSERTAALFEATGGEWTCKDKNLGEKLTHVRNLIPVGPYEPPQNEDWPNKRPRLSIFNDDESLSNLFASQVYSLLGNQPANDLAGLRKIAATGYVKLSTEQQCKVVDSLGLLSCAYSGMLHRSKAGSEYIYRCSFCDTGIESRDLIPGQCKDGEDSEILETFKVLITLDEFNESPTVKCRAMRSLKRVTNHTYNLEYLELGKSALGSWCIGGLFSSRRELRIAAGRILPSFVNFTREDREFEEAMEKREMQMTQQNMSQMTRISRAKGQQIAEHNRIMIAKELHTFTEPKFQETCVMAWGQLGRIYKATDLNLVLVRLVEYLGHSSTFITGVALSELSDIARVHRVTPRRLLSPFYRSISYPVVSHLITKPQIAENLTSLLAMDVDEFLKTTRVYTLPYLVLSQNRKVINRIAAACGHEGQPQIICHDNIAPILSVLFVQNVDDLERNAQRLLEGIAPAFKASKVDELVRPDAVPIAGELLKSYSDADQEMRLRILKALKLVAKLCEKKPPKSKKQDKQDPLGSFFQMHVLGLCQHFSESMREPHTMTPLSDKIRCLNAVKDMLELAKGWVVDGLPQITAYLQQAMESEELRANALLAWKSAIENLEDHQVQSIIGQTFSLVVQYWGQLDVTAYTGVREMIDHLFSDRRRAIKEVVDSIPSLASIPLFSKYNKYLLKWRDNPSPDVELRHLITRVKHENGAVVEQALVELVEALKRNEATLHKSIVLEKPDSVISEIVRCLLDVVLRFKDTLPDMKQRINDLCGQCLGLIGALDPAQVEAPREKEEMIVLHYFSKADESKDFVLFFLEKVLVKAFLAATESKSQLLLAWAAQELLRFCDLTSETLFSRRLGQKTPIQKKWESLSVSARATLTPLLTSKYVLGTKAEVPEITYPVFSNEITYRGWINAFLQDIMSNYVGENASTIFSTCLRILKGQNIAILHFLLPYAVTQNVICGTPQHSQNIAKEFLAVMKHRCDSSNPHEIWLLQHCSEAVFMVTDYMTRWLRDRRRYNVEQKERQRRKNTNVHGDDADPEADYDEPVQKVDAFLKSIPPDLMGLRSLEVQSYSRALLYWEQHIRQTSATATEAEMEPLYQELQKIYTHIDEPDGMEGISTKIANLDIEQQVLEHRKAGRWTAALTWYEQMVEQRPGDRNLQNDLVSCLRDSGQFDVLLRQIDSMMATSPVSHSALLPSAVEASWVTGQWNLLEKYLQMSVPKTNYDVSLGRSLLALKRGDLEDFQKQIMDAREDVVSALTETTASSVRQCHGALVKLHALTELTDIAAVLSESTDLNTAVRNEDPITHAPGLKNRLETRLHLLGMYEKDKQYILALRRAAFELSPHSEPIELLPQPGRVPNQLPVIDELKVSAWLSTARIARKASAEKQAFKAVHHALRLNKTLSAVEHAKLLWHCGQHQHAIRNLTKVLESRVLEFDASAKPDARTVSNSTASTIGTAATAAGGRSRTVTADGKMTQSMRVAKAKLLRAKWIDETGRTSSDKVLEQYRDASSWFAKWEQGFYYIGRYYNRLYMEQSELDLENQTQVFVTGELARLIAQNYARALRCGVKYIFQTMPRLLTVWLDLGDNLGVINTSKSLTLDYISFTERGRKKSLDAINDTITRSVTRDLLHPWMFYTAFPQIISRMTHSHKAVYDCIETIIYQVLNAYPQQALWSIAAASKSTDVTRNKRGNRILRKLQQSKAQPRGNSGRPLVMTDLVHGATRLTDQLVRLCNVEISTKIMSTTLSASPISMDPAKMAPVGMFVPAQRVLAITLPPPTFGMSEMQEYMPFMEGQPTIEKFEENVEIMNSLQKPRRITIVGSDGKRYGFLCKPKDDLRKDQRLLEFSTMIDRLLKKDPESHRRRLLIRTYCVTPLNEECGLIEWVENIRTLRDIILKNLGVRGIKMNYHAIRTLLDESSSDGANNTQAYYELLRMYPPVFADWFLTTFPDPSTWFTSRLRYTHTCAAMSMVGSIIGLGDRHGENILFSTLTGDTVHVDFNCLFDKGLSFEKPERVPFRLTQNMVDALGPSGAEGVFRKACETTIRLLRNNIDTMMTVLEAFTHDPAVDMVSNVHRRKQNFKPGVMIPPRSQKEVMERIVRRLRGVVEEAERGGEAGRERRGGGVGGEERLSVEGQVEVLISRAIDPDNLKNMYVGWCPFF